MDSNGRGGLKKNYTEIWMEFGINTGTQERGGWPAIPM